MEILSILQKRARITALLAALCAPFAAAQIQLISRPVPPPDAVERGQKAFVATCGFCHGTTARGGQSGPDLVRSVVVLDDENAEHIGPVILKGRPDKGMPAFELPPAQVSDIAAFLRSLTQSAINRRDYKVQEVVTGDAKAGQAYFNGAGKCNTCHSAAGDLAGVGSRYQPYALQTRFLYPGRGPDKKPSQVSVKLSSGQTFSGTLEYLDDFTVALRDADGAYHSWPRDAAQATIRDPYSAHEEMLRKYSDADIHNLLAYLVTLK